MQMKIENQNIDTLDGLLTLTEASAFLKRKERTLRLDVQRRRIPYVRLFGSVRFRREDLTKLIEKSAVPVGRG